MTNHTCRFEIGCRDRAKAADFYSKMFDWKMEPNGLRILKATRSGFMLSRLEARKCHN